MQINEEILLAFGFEKNFGWGQHYYKHKSDSNFMLHNGICQSEGKIFKTPETVEEFSEILKEYYMYKYTKEGKENLQIELQSLLGI